MLKDLFKRTQYATVEQAKLFPEKKAINIDIENKSKIPDGAWIKCEACSKALYREDVEQNAMICPECGKHYRLTSNKRIAMIIDNGTFEEYDADLTSCNPLNFKGYDLKIEKLMEETKLKEAVITGFGNICGSKAVIAVMDSRFLMGSMGSVVGEKLARAIEKATYARNPLVIFTASGGARMQEGILSLMQMAKVSAALKRHSEEGLLSIIVLTDPTTGGVTASFAMLGDIILSEPGALIGFAGQRVIEQTIRQKLPEGFQRAEFLLEHGFIDKIINRKELKDTIGNILMLHEGAS